MTSISDALRATCMKARIVTSAFGRTVTVKDASRRATQDAHAIDGAARVVANKLAGADEHDRRIRDAQRLAVTALHALSMPYSGEDGWRLLPTKNFMPPSTLLASLAKAQTAFNDAL